jgi:lipoprotein-anchoring transpeptidase ErfK/SrfK
MKDNSLSRRQFIKLGSAGVGVIAASRYLPGFQTQDFPVSDKLGRVCYGRWDLKARPDYDSETVGQVFDDQIIEWSREVAGRWPFRQNQKWIETPNGYLWSAYIQPVFNNPNNPVSSLPDTSIGPGMWVEVSVPYVDLQIINPPPRHPYFRDRYENGLPLRFYYSQILWVDQIRTNSNGIVEYRVNEKYGNRGDFYWADAQAFRPLTEDEIAPISPNVEEKRVVVDITTGRQYLSCFEGNTEVYYCRISSGRAAGSTPLGTFTIWRKLVSIHMEGGTAVQGWDVCGVGWTNLFTSNGVAVHSTYWHNNFGEQESNGCVNVAPEDAKWVFRWTNPGVEYIPGEHTVTDFQATKVSVIQG